MGQEQIGGPASLVAAPFLDLFGGHVADHEGALCNACTAAEVAVLAIVLTITVSTPLGSVTGAALGACLMPSWHVSCVSVNPAGVDVQGAGAPLEDVRAMLFSGLGERLADENPMLGGRLESGTPTDPALDVFADVA
jgi:hypothetical protein